VLRKCHLTKYRSDFRHPDVWRLRGAGNGDRDALAVAREQRRPRDLSRQLRRWQYLVRLQVE
jgi:hypothetical protein